ncbi:transcriptional activator HlyU [Rhizobium sp. KVB221]|uniref:Transcriptional activator HlyU n=1 Tax=Rhizobium setariae TaxID=2801340 RepID=A0A937CP69_9HYPH|nr:HlyU family transcriptional regulator [Rhizobium setariae]MBL0372849.1 transcriptional activator HlyU [Rhizobium setariae]
MAGFFSKLFGGSSSVATPTKEQTQKIGEYTVYATPRKEGAQYRLAGRIEHEANGQKMVRNFVRADLFSSESDTVETTFRKAKQIIDQHGSTLFGDGAAERQV